MKLNTDVFAIIDPSTLEVLGNGDGPAIYMDRPDQKEIALVLRLSQRTSAEVIQARLVRLYPQVQVFQDSVVSG